MPYSALHRALFIPPPNSVMLSNVQTRPPPTSERYVIMPWALIVSGSTNLGENVEPPPSQFERW